MQKIEIYSITKGSIAQDLGIEPGDFLISINSQQIYDVFDYRFYIEDSELILDIEKKDGERWQFHIQKDESEDLGLEFVNSLMDVEKSCKNNCIFCFIDQLPKNMRSTLYFKDDDARLSFLFGNYITMTNLTDHEIDRIIKYHMSPVNISVHTTNPELRKEMLNNRFAGDVLDKIKKFALAGITINTQIVLCPGINDGPQLDRTIEDLSSLFPLLHSISVVPVGITKYRHGLTPLKPFNKQSAAQVINQVENWQKRLLDKYGSRIVYLADELYIKSELPLPDYEAYEGFPQIENGVGMVTSFLNEVDLALVNFESHKLSKNAQSDSDRVEDNNRIISIATGESIYETINKISKRVENCIKGLKINVYKVENTFFGPHINVTGLLTGHDLIRELFDKDLGHLLLLSKTMFKAQSDILLDDITVKDLEQNLGVKIKLVETDGKAFIDALIQE